MEQGAYEESTQRASEGTAAGASLTSTLQPPSSIGTLQPQSSTGAADEATPILGHAAESGAVTPPRMTGPRLSGLPASSAPAATPKSRSPRGQHAGLNPPKARTRGHADLCITVCACDPTCLSEQWADRWILDIDPTSDDEHAWRISMSPMDAEELYRRAKALVEVRTTTPEGHPTSIRDISPTQPMRQPQWEAALTSLGQDVAPPYTGTAVPIPMTPDAGVEMEGLTRQVEEEAVPTHSTTTRVVVRVPAPTPPANYEASYAQLFAEADHRAYAQMRRNACWSPHYDEGELPVGVHYST